MARALECVRDHGGEVPAGAGTTRVDSSGERDGSAGAWRKSFLGAVTGRTVAERGPASLAAELFAARQGVAWIRTHDVRSLRDALRVQEELEPRR